MSLSDDTLPDHYLARPLTRRPILLNYGFSGDFEDQKACSAAIRRGSKSFHLASLLLPRQPVWLPARFTPSAVIPMT